MTQEISLETLHGRIEAIQAIQMATLMALASQANVNLPGVAKFARDLARVSAAKGDALDALNAQLDTLDAFASIPNR